MTTAKAPSEMVVTDALQQFGKLNIGVDRATAIANQLKPIVEKNGLSVRIGSSEHLKVEGWQTIGMFCGVTPQTEWTQEVRNPKSGELEGYKARVQVMRLSTGEAVGAAECICHFDEQQKRRDGSGLYERWVEHGRPNRHACMSMAQTRATSKALAQMLRWIPVLAGYSGTPFEEMPQEAHGDREEERLPRAATPPRQSGAKLATEKQLKMLYAKSVARAKVLTQIGTDYKDAQEHAGSIRSAAMKTLGFDGGEDLSFAAVTPMMKAIESTILDDEGRVVIPDGAPF